MGLILTFKTDTGQRIPFWFTESDSKFLRRHIILKDAPTDELYRILHHFQLSLEPLSADKLVDREPPTLEEFMSVDPDDETREAYWREYIAKRETAWQTPEIIIDAILPLVAALDSDLSIFDKLGIEDFYFTSGGFRQDLVDMVAMLKWAQTNGVKKVLLTEG